MSAVPALLAAFNSCSSPFSSCDEKRVCPGSQADDGGDGGQGGEGQSQGGRAGGAQGGSATQGGEGGVPGDGGTAGAGGSPGAGGAAGDGGAGGSPECVEDADCQNQSFCDGTEHCENGKCEPGSPACNNPDAAHCNVACTEGETEAVCTVTAKDLDGDEHGTNACAAAPGNDCNDDNDTIYTGAPELCDRLDNDCDDKPDFEDGLVVSGGAGYPLATVVGADYAVSAPAVAFAPDNELFGTVWQEKNSTGSPASVVTNFAAIPFSATNPAFYRTLDSVTTADTGGPGAPDLAWGGSTFGAVWTVEHITATRVKFRTVDTAGGLYALLQPKSSGTARSIFARVTRTPTAWVTSWFQGTTDTDRVVTARTIDDADVMGSAVNLLGMAFRLVNGLASNDQYVIAKSDVQGGNGQYVVRTPALAAVGGTADFPGEFGVIAGDNAGFGLVYAQAFVPTFRALQPNGQTMGACGPVALGVTGQIWDIISTQRGYLVLIGQGASSVLVEVGRDCSVGKPMQLTDVAIGLGGSLAGNTTTGFAVVWTLPGFKSVRYRMFGPNFCD